jgi:hypothetical protein
MEQILERLADLEKRLALLENKETTTKQEFYDFITAINTITITEENINNIFNTTFIEELIKIILNKNKEMPFIQYKKHVYKYDKNTMVKMEDEDYATLFKHIEYLIIQAFMTYSNNNLQNSEDYFKKTNIIYGLNINKNLKKIKLLFLQSL